MISWSIIGIHFVGTQMILCIIEEVSNVGIQTQCTQSSEITKMYVAFLLEFVEQVRPSC
jgi:hypothetical protein